MRFTPTPYLLLLTLLLLELGATSAGATPPGDLDHAFGTNGRVTTDFLGEDRVRAVVVQPDGKIVVGGTRLLGDNLDFALARYETDGTPDATFGNGGKLTTDFGATEDALLDVLLMPDGRILAMGGLNPVGVELARYLADGSLDPSFGNGGKVQAFVDGFVTAVALQSDGKIIVGGSRITGPFPASDFVLARFAADGALDPSFGSGGFVVTAFPGGRQDGVNSLAVQADGKILAAGFTVLAIQVASPALARYESDGSLDASFGSGGLVIPNLPSEQAFFDVIVQPDGKIVTASGYDPALHRFLPDGSPDLGFGAGGQTSFPAFGLPQSVVMDSTGAFVVAIDTSSPPAELRRALSDGTVDASFGIAARVPIDLFTYAGNYDRDVAIASQPDGAIVAAGTTTQGADFATERYAGDHVLTCPALPAVGCTAPAGTRRAVLQIDERQGRWKLGWRWRRGDATTADVGDPTASDDYALCVYDESGAPTLVSGLLAPSGGECAGEPCWRAKAAGRKFVYGDEDGTPLGITMLEVKTGTAGKAGLRARAGGDHLTPPPLPAGLPLRVQLQSAAGGCWEAVFTAAGARRNDATSFQGKSE